MNSTVPIVAHDRTVHLDEELTIREAILELNKRGQVFSLRRTMQLYGLTFVEERSFTSKYRQEFRMIKGQKTMYDIKLKELAEYKSLLIGIPVKR